LRSSMYALSSCSNFGRERTIFMACYRLVPGAITRIDSAGRQHRQATDRSQFKVTPIADDQERAAFFLAIIDPLE
jgi:hypothetical protein